MDSLVSVEWLSENIAEPDVLILDATWHLPNANRDAREEFAKGHIPNASFLDLGTLNDPTSPVPVAIPNASQLALRLSELGVTPASRIVLYDDSAIKTAARAWFILRAYGWTDVAILDGGLEAWRAAGHSTSSEARQADQSPELTLDGPRGVASKGAVLANVDEKRLQVVDARGADRVYGTGEDPVHGGPMGRIPGSLNVPFNQLFRDDGTFRGADELRSAFTTAGVDLDQSVVTTCGSGFTASVLAFALHLIGKDDVALYDGSWLEWSADPSTPKAQGMEHEGS